MAGPDPISWAMLKVSIWAVCSRLSMWASSSQLSMWATLKVSIGAICSRLSMWASCFRVSMWAICSRVSMWACSCCSRLKRRAAETWSCIQHRYRKCKLPRLVGAGAGAGLFLVVLCVCLLALGNPFRDDYDERQYMADEEVAVAMRALEGERSAAPDMYALWRTRVRPIASGGGGGADSGAAGTPDDAHDDSASPAKTPVSREQLALNLRIELPIITVAPSSKMANLRELAGSTKRYCPRCSLLIYGWDLSSDHAAEVSQWDHVHLYDVKRDLLAGVAFDRTFSAVQAAIVHALQDHSRGLYVSVDLSFTGTLEPLDLLLRNHGHVLVEDKGVSSHGRQDVVSALIQGYDRAGKAFSDVAVPLAATPCQIGAVSPCMWGRSIRLPTAGLTPFFITSALQLPIREQNLQGLSGSAILPPPIRPLHPPSHPSSLSVSLFPHSIRVHRVCVSVCVCVCVSAEFPMRTVYSCVCLETDVFVKFQLLSEANANVDSEDITYSTKPYHTELESFGNSNLCMKSLFLSSPLSSCAVARSAASMHIHAGFNSFLHV